MEGGTIFHFVTDGIEAALKQAREAAQTESVKVEVGIDTFIIRNGEILVQTIYYDVIHAEALSQARGH